MKNAAKWVWQILCSLKFAVIILSSLTAALIAATLLESKYDTATAQYYVYRNPWFFAVLGALFVNILCVALSRLPWQKKHLPFLLAHLGILLLLYGSWVTYQFGLDGQMSVQEGTRESSVDLNDSILALADGDQVRTMTVPWIPPETSFRPIEIPDLGLRVTQYITHAESKVEFLPAETAGAGVAAIHLKIQGGPKAPPFMRMGQDFWLWLGEKSWSQSQVGGANVALAQEVEPMLPITGAGLGLKWSPKTQRMQASLRTSDGKKRTLDFTAAELKGQVIATGWKFEATVAVLDFIPEARSQVSYTPAMLQYGPQAAPAAILLSAEGAGGRTAETWLGMGERATLETRGKKVTLGFFPRRKVLPFGVELHEFKIENYEGTNNPREFSSRVSVTHDGVAPPSSEVAPRDRVISMNEPMKFGGYTFYQASYLPGEPRPTISVFSVNQDPGRWVKYLGSILLTSGSALLFLMRYWAMNARKKKDANA